MRAKQFDHVPRGVEVDPFRLDRESNQITGCVDADSDIRSKREVAELERGDHQGSGET